MIHGPLIQSQCGRIFCVQLTEALPSLRGSGGSPGLQGQQTRPLVVLLLSGRRNHGAQIQRLLQEVDQRRFGEQRRQDLSEADGPLVFGDLRPRAGDLGGGAPLTADLGGGALVAGDLGGGAPVAGLPDLQHQAGHRGDGLEQPALLRVSVEHDAERLTELDELTLGRKR